MCRKKKPRTVLWVIIGAVVGAFIPSACSRVEMYAQWLVGSSCWSALVQLEQLKARLAQPVNRLDLN